MRPSGLLAYVATTSLASADMMTKTKLDTSAERGWPGFGAKQTGHSEVNAISGWTPKPTPAPGMLDVAQEALELLRGRQLTNTWENARTCGYYAGTSSSAFVCDANSTCATNQQNVIACTSGTYKPFFSVCFNYDAVQQGACSLAGPATGCCESSSLGACGTLLWGGSQTRSMYQCFATPTILSMNDVPQFVLDAATKSTSTSSTSTSSKSSSSSTTSTSTGSLVPVTTTTGTNGGGSNSGSSTNIGAIVGGVIGGVALLAALAGLIAFLVIYKKKKSKKSDSANGEQLAALPNHEYHGSPDMSQSNSTGLAGSAGYGSPSMGTAGYHPHEQGQGSIHDPNATYYNPSRYGSPESQQYGAVPPHAQHNGGQFPQRHTSPSTSPGWQQTSHDPRYSTMSAELPNSAPSGFTSNPAEMSAEQHQQHPSTASAA